jgi:hypothetical protein
MVVQGYGAMVNCDFACLIGAKPSYANDPRPGVEVINAQVNVTYPDDEEYSVPVPVPIFYSGLVYTYSSGASFQPKSLTLPSPGGTNSTDCAAAVDNLKLSNSELRNSGQSVYFETTIGRTNQSYGALGVVGFYLEDQHARVRVQSSSGFTVINSYGGTVRASWSSLNVVSGSTYIVVLQIGFATYLTTVTQSTPTGTTEVPVGVVFSSGNYCSVSATLQPS